MGVLIFKDTVFGKSGAFSNRAQVAQVNGGIDLDTTNGMQWKVSKDG